MPRGYPFEDKRLENAIELYLRIWPQDGREHAARMVQIGVMSKGVKALTLMMQKQLEAMGRAQNEQGETGQDQIVSS